MFDTIHHIAIIGSDYEKSKHFYVDLLGFEIIRENYRKERDDYKIDFSMIQIIFHQKSMNNQLL